MTDSDFNYIKPVENLHSVHSLSPAQEREEQKRRQKQQQQARAPQPQQPTEQPPKEEPPTGTPDQQDDSRRIDYCA